MLLFQLATFPLLTFAGIRLGRFSARRRLWWLAGLAPLAIIALVILGHRSQRLHFAVPISWAIDADLNPPLMTFLIALLFTTLRAKLPQPRRRAVSIVMAAMLIFYGLLPALLPLAVRSSLAATTTTLDRHGICLQQHAYTCGPAAAVTCLGQLGFSADESQLAIAARCGPAVGTDGHLLAAAVMRAFPAVRCQYRFVESLQDLHPPAVADMNLPLIGGHYVAVLEVRGDAVVVGDPMSGRQRVPVAEFLSAWTHGTIEMSR